MGKHRDYTTITVIDSRTGNTLTWANGALSHTPTPGGRALAARARQLASPPAPASLDDPGWARSRRASLDPAADAADILATMLYACQGHGITHEAPEDAVERLLDG